MPLSTIMRSIICRIECASPRSRRVSDGKNQLKQLLGLFQRCCSGEQHRKSMTFCQVRPAGTVVVHGGSLCAAMQGDDQRGTFAQTFRHMTEHAQIAGVAPEGRSFAMPGRSGRRARSSFRG